MILRIFKGAAIAAIWYFVSPWLAEEQPNIVTGHWTSGCKQWAVFEALSLWVQILFFISTGINAWGFGEQQSNGERLFELRHKKLLKYSGVPLLFFLFVSVLVTPLPLKDDEQRARLWVTACVLFVVAPTLLDSTGEKDKKTVYGLEHGRLHLNVQVPMWMNMGYWNVSVF